MTPSNNDLESFWRTLKETMLTDQRVGHRKLLEYTFPQMLFLLYPDYTGPPFRRSDGVERKSTLECRVHLARVEDAGVSACVRPVVRQPVGLPTCEPILPTADC